MKRSGMRGGIGRSNYLPSEPLSLKTHPQFNERWLQDQIAKDPRILGLGDLTLKDYERRQFRSGRLDLLLEDDALAKRYEVEIQLGATDESHIIRTIEYWDNERKKFPHFDHCAVIVAEDITSRFLNVVSLFNRSIPLVALQVRAFVVGEYASLVFTKVFDEVRPDSTEHLLEEDRESVNREFWENKASKEMVGLADRCLELLREIEPALEMTYKKHYMGLSLQGLPHNFVIFKPQRSALRIELAIRLAEEQIQELESEGIEVSDYSTHYRKHPIRIRIGDFENVLGGLRKAFDWSKKSTA